MNRFTHIGRTASLGLLVFAMHSAPAMAQQGKDTGSQIKQDQRRTTDEIIVTATRTKLPISALPITVDIVDTQKLTSQVAMSGSTVDAISALVPSFSPTRQKLTGSGESLRGRSPLFAINGVPQTTPIRNSSRDGHSLDPFFVDRIELIYGSNALQGIGATGGVINQVLVSAPEVEGISGRTLVQASADSGFDDDGFGGKVAALINYRSGAFDASIGATFERRGAFYDGHGNRIGVDTTQGEIQDSDSYSIFGRFGYQLSDSARIELVANRFSLESNTNYVPVAGDRATGIPSTSVRGTTPGEPASNRNELISLSLTDDDLGGGTFTLQGFFNRSRDIFGGGVFGTFQDPSIDPSGTLFEQSANRSRKLGGKLSYERELIENLTITGGFDALFDRTKQVLVQTDRTWVPETEFQSLAPFTQANLGLFDRLITIAGGVRWENVELKVDDFTTIASAGNTMVAGGNPKFDEFLPNVGLIIEPITGIRAYGSYTKGYTIPDVGRILRGINTPGVDIDNFLDVNPIISDNRELGLEVKRGPLDASVTYFWSSSDFGQRLVLNTDGIFDLRREAVEIEGIEINLGVETPLPGLKIGVGYSDLAGRVDTDGDGKVDDDLDGSNISPDRFNLSANYENGPFSAVAQAQFYLSRSFKGQPSSADFEGYTLFNAQVRYETELGAFSLSAQNLFDEYYISYDSDTVRTTDSSRFYAGRGRTVTLGWDWRF
ncbi:TonB-dependent receptor [Parasphingorhabdus sp. JC815]|uniref:TonB-dependent receptor n=1 Tax=Parasphingorhabdus sp. JC815 TaxID=3232140 RepID=UPI00345B1B30